MNEYEGAILDTKFIIEEFKDKLIDCLFEIAINGELKEWAENVEVGEDFYFSKELYESLNDLKIKHLVSIINHLETKFPVSPC